MQLTGLPFFLVAPPRAVDVRGSQVRAPDSPGGRGGPPGPRAPPPLAAAEGAAERKGPRAGGGAAQPAGPV